MAVFYDAAILQRERDMPLSSLCAIIEEIRRVRVALYGIKTESIYAVNTWRQLRTGQLCEKLSGILLLDTQISLVGNHITRIGRHSEADCSRPCPICVFSPFNGAFAPSATARPSTGLGRAEERSCSWARRSRRGSLGPGFAGSRAGLSPAG